MLLQDGRNLLCWAAANGFLPIVMHLLDMGAALEATDKVNTNLLTRSLPVPPNLQIFESVGCVPARKHSAAVGVAQWSSASHTDPAGAWRKF
jgi:hypothetical protein